MPNEQPKEVTNGELLKFIQENVPTKTELANIQKTLDEHTATLNSHTVSLDGITNDLKTVKQELTFDRKRISRLESHTKKLLGKKLDKANADFEEEYKGEQARAEQEAAG
jgi:DNA repair ATPase RecN